MPNDDRLEIVFRRWRGFGRAGLHGVMGWRDMRRWCRGRDLNPGHGLERPAYLAGLYYRGIRAAVHVTLLFMYCPVYIAFSLYRCASPFNYYH
jgi:hypothetical protein